MKKTNFDRYLEEQLRDPVFAARFKNAGEAWDVALQIAALREQAGLSQKALAKLLKTSQQQISRLESPGYEGHSLGTLRRVADKPGVAAAIFVPLAEANINVDMIIQVVSDDTTTTDITFTVPSAEFLRAKAILEERRSAISYSSLQGAQDVVKVSAIGVGMRSHSGVAARMFEALANTGVNIDMISTSEIKISVVIDLAKGEAAMKAVHAAFLD